MLLENTKKMSSLGLSLINQAGLKKICLSKSDIKTSISHSKKIKLYSLTPSENPFIINSSYSFKRKHMTKSLIRVL